MSKIDYTFKAEVLNSGLVEVQRKVSYAQFLHYEYGILESTFSMPYEEAEEVCQTMRSERPIEWEEAVRINASFYKRVKRLRDRVNCLLISPCIFLTLTFDDNSLRSTTPETRRRYVTRFLKAQGCSYVANIDFGKENGREHYHAIIQTQNVNYDVWHDIGAIKGERIIVNNVEALAKYVAKLSNHAIKETTKRSSLIYSR